MAEMKTKPNKISVDKFLSTVANEETRADCETLVKLMQEATGAPPVMWGSSIVGFGKYHYKYASGREGDWLLTGFSPRKQNLTLYIMAGFEGYSDLMAQIGKHTTGKSCLYVKRPSDLHLPTLRKLVRASVKHMKAASK